MYRSAVAVLALFAAIAFAQKKPDLDKLLEKHTFKGEKGSLPYRLMKPATIEKDKKYPLVIFLHGAGERGDNNTAQIKHGVADFAKESTRKKHPCFLIAPQCAAKAFWPGEPVKLVLELIEQTCKDQPIDRSRIYVTGLSMGGYGSWDIMARKPELFAAGIPICGGGKTDTADKLTKIPIWVFHGDKDSAVKVERSREMVEAIKKAGGKPKYTEYPGVNHDSWTRTYSNPEVIDWLFEQKKAK